MKKTIILTALSALFCAEAGAQHVHDADSSGMTSKDHGLKELKVTSKGGTRRMVGPVNGVSIGRHELFKAACCNLGESFTTNPSVDVSYSDAATGAKQIRLLGLSGTYVQMLTENLPNYRGAASPYALGYVPGPWMKNISVSKGCSSVKNGYEAITGQINIDFLKPEDADGMEVNLFGDSKSRVEANITGNIHLNSRLSTVLLTHYENSFDEHDGNGDGFYDQPRVRQVHLDNRWQWAGDRYIFHGGVSWLKERRLGGQLNHGLNQSSRPHTLYNIEQNTDRYEGYMKHAFILDPDHGTNVALLTSASLHEQTADYGLKHLYINEKNVYASLVFETNIGHEHNFSAGVSFLGQRSDSRYHSSGQIAESGVQRYDYFSGQIAESGVQRYDYSSGQIAESGLQRYDYSSGMTSAPTGSPLNSPLNGNHTSSLIPLDSDLKESTPGVYAQYTLNLNHRLTVMAGLRADHSSLYGTFLTPRVHVKWMPHDVISLRLSAGKGYRTVFALAENSYLLAGGRRLTIDDLRQEEAWNYGASAALNIPLWGKTLKMNAEYYYTRFSNQAVVDYDSDPHAIHIANLDGRSYSHTMQIDATYPVVEGLTLTAAYRLSDVKCTYGGRLMTKPLTNRYKGLLTASYKTPLELWQFDVTFQLNGGGRMPQPYVTDNGTLSWQTSFPAFGQLSAQVTRWFRHWSVYVGGENLTAYRQKNPIIGASDPWSRTFDPTMIWGPVHGAMAYMGVRINIGKK